MEILVQIGPSLKCISTEYILNVQAWAVLNCEIMPLGSSLSRKKGAISKNWFCKTQIHSLLVSDPPHLLHQGNWLFSQNFEFLNHPCHSTVRYWHKNFSTMNKCSSLAVLQHSVKYFTLKLCRKVKCGVILICCSACFLCCLLNVWALIFKIHCKQIKPFQFSVFNDGRWGKLKVAILKALSHFKVLDSLCHLVKILKRSTARWRWN